MMQKAGKYLQAGSAG